jgi:hypothetical protein
MKTVKELIDAVNVNKLTTPNMLDDVFDKKDALYIKTVDFDEHRWYTIGTTVYRVADGYVGVRGPVSLASESSDWDDLGITCTAFEMEEVASVTYRKKDVK